tara:strand:+ start:237 stop:530 length:294 start_codon:yes stop_codon:yes gene_type:complete
MKVKEKAWMDGDNLIVKNTHDVSGMVKDAEFAREINGVHKFGQDNIHLGNIDPVVLRIWLEEAGVAWTDVEGIKDVVKRKLMSNEFSKLRGSWTGTW